MILGVSFAHYNIKYFDYYYTIFTIYIGYMGIHIWHRKSTAVSSIKHITFVQNSYISLGYMIYKLKHLKYTGINREDNLTPFNHYLRILASYKYLKITHSVTSAGHFIFIATHTTNVRLFVAALQYILVSK